MKSTEHPVGINELGMSFLFRVHMHITQNMSFLFSPNPSHCVGEWQWNLSNIELKDNCVVGGSHRWSSFAGSFGQEERSANYCLGGVSLATCFCVFFSAACFRCSDLDKNATYWALSKYILCWKKRLVLMQLGWGQGNYLHDIMIFLTGKFLGEGG